MLLSNEALDDLLHCPNCIGSLQRQEEQLACTHCESRYGFIDGKPVLADEDSVRLFGLDLAGDRVTGLAAADDRVLSAPGSLGTLKRSVKRLVVGRSTAGEEVVSFIRNERAGCRTRLLVIGGGTTRPELKPLLEQPDMDVLSFDVYPSHETNFFADAHRIPLAKCSVDVVWIQAVLEHVQEPWVVAQEIERVCKIGGLIYAETPFLQSVHEGAYDFFRFGAAGARVLFRNTTDEMVKVVAGAGVVMQWSVRDVVTLAFNSRKLGTVAYTAMFWLRWIGKGDSQKALDRASCVGVLLRRSESTRSNRDIRDLYGRCSD